MTECNSKVQRLSEQAAYELGGGRLAIALAINIDGSVTAFASSQVLDGPVNLPVNAKKILEVSGINVGSTTLVRYESNPEKCFVHYKTLGGGEECYEVPCP